MAAAAGDRLAKNETVLYLRAAADGKVYNVPLCFFES